MSLSELRARLAAAKQRQQEEVGGNSTVLKASPFKARHPPLPRSGSTWSGESEGATVVLALTEYALHTAIAP